MTTYFASFAVGEGDDERLDPELRRNRERQIVACLFSLGPAWMPSASAVFFVAEATVEQIVKRIGALVKDYDTFFIVEVVSTGASVYRGVLIDDEGAANLFPQVDLRPT